MGGLVLYNAPQSTCSQRVRFVLNAKGLEFAEHKLDLFAGDQLKEDYLKLNPNGVVPTLVHGDAVIVDSSVICEYLDEVFPDIRLTPGDPVARAHMRKWLRYFEEVPTPAVRYPSFQMALIKNFQKLSPEAFEQAANARPLRRHFYMRMGQDGFSQEEIDKAADDIANTVARMEGALAAGGPWLMGDAYTLADICVAPSIDRMEDLGYEALWEDGHPLVTDWFRRMKARPAYAKAYYKGARMSEIYPELELGRASPVPA